MTACAGGSGPKINSQSSPPSAAAPCEPLVPAPKAGAPGPPVAVLRDAAGPPNEYVLGSPGAKGQLLPLDLLAGIPRMVAGRVYVTAYTSASVRETGIQVVGAGGCRHFIAPGTVDQVDPHGRAIASFVGNERRLLDSAGKQVAKLNPGAVAWTYDDHLIQASVQSLRVADADASHERVLVKGYRLLFGPAGRSGMIEGTSTETFLLDTTTGKETLVAPKRAGVATGSPDGRYLAMVDLAGQGALVHIPDLASSPLKIPGPVSALAWTADSQWLAIQTQFGGAILHLADMKYTDLGSVNVVSW